MNYKRFLRLSNLFVIDDSETESESDEDELVKTARSTGMYFQMFSVQLKNLISSSPSGFSSPTRL